ncbi:hypothetical protein AACH06_00130 [Ideonella sp. DXS29W]|uniref:PEGA domain-containing protein n=1 Tax=Ideonella lacteola TaxID=2984193 RepID=A0ABU9BKM8_9BURK
MKQFLSRAIVSAAAVVLAGCATQVQFESSPPGAEVTYDRNGTVLGTTPFSMSIKDDFGWFSVYQFTARLDGYEPVVLSFAERTPLDAQQVVPSVVRFEFKKTPVASAEPAASAVQ